MTTGREPRHAGTTPDEGRVEQVAEQIAAEGMDRLAAEIVAEQKLHDLPDPVPDPAGERRADEDDEPLPSMSEQVSEQLGGVRGLIESSIPVLAFVVLNVVLGADVAGLAKRTALSWAIAGAVGTAVLIGGYRLYRKEPIRHAVNGLFGIAVGAFLAYRTGEAKDFYLPGILLTLAQSVVLVASVVVRKPIIGYVWGVLANKGRHDWFDNKQLFRTFQWLTLVWAASLFVRAGIQGVLYLQDNATAIGVVRILISWPIYAATFAFTVWAVRRVTRRQEAEAQAAGAQETETQPAAAQPAAAQEAEPQAGTRSTEIIP